MTKTRLPLLLAVAYGLLLPAVLPADTVVEEIIARVNNEIVTRTEYVRSRDQLKQEIQQQYVCWILGYLKKYCNL